MPKQKFELKDVQLPDETLEWLHAYEVEESQSQWKLGDLAAELVDRFKGTFGRSLIMKRLAIEAGVRTSTVRDREGMARFFTLEVREEFDVLSYHQLRACKQAQERWRKLAEWALESADEFGGRPAPVEAIRLKAKGNEDGKKAWDDRIRAMRSNAEKVVEDEAVPAGMAEICRLFLDSTTSVA